MIKYYLAEDIKKRAEEIARILFPHARMNEVVCVRSRGTSSRGIIARCHSLGKIMQLALNRKGFYVLEFISERFDKLDEKEQEKVIIHELMHIPKCFGGGFRHHDFVTRKNIDKLYSEYLIRKEKNETGFKL